MEEKSTSEQKYKNQQHLNVQKAAEEETWISGEELRTDGSSDEEKKRKTSVKINKKLKVRRKSSTDKKLNHQTPPLTTNEEASPSPSCSSNLGESLDLENKWRPKRGSLKLPDLYDDESNQDYKSQGIQLFEELIEKINFLKYNKGTKLEQLEDSDDEETRSLSKYDKIVLSIRKMEQRLEKNRFLLELERHDRLKTQEEMCQEICKDERFYDKSASFFLNLCHFEDNPSSSDSSSGDENEEFGVKKPKRLKRINGGKDFIRRNIELAAKAMTNLPLTDEEKHKLDQILREDGTENEEDVPTNETVDVNQGGSDELVDNCDQDWASLNAFHVLDQDKQRIHQIDLALKEYNDGPKTPQNPTMDAAGGERVWPNLEEALKEVDKKLSQLIETSHKSIIESANVKRPE